MFRSAFLQISYSTSSWATRLQLIKILAIFAFSTFSQSKSHADEVVLAADIWCPYNCEAESNQPGFMVEIARQAFQKSGHNLQYKVLPWSRALEEARSGKYAGVFGAYKHDAQDFIFPDKPVTKSAISFFVNKGNRWRYSSIADLKNITLGAILDYSYGELLDGYIAENKANTMIVQLIAGENGLDSNTKKLLANRIGAVIEDRQVMAYYKKTHALNEKIEEAGSLGEEEVYIAFSPNSSKSKLYANIINDYLIEITQSGHLTTIFQKYGIE